MSKKGKMKVMGTGIVIFVICAVLVAVGIGYWFGGGKATATQPVYVPTTPQTTPGAPAMSGCYSSTGATCPYDGATWTPTLKQENSPGTVVTDQFAYKRLRVGDTTWTEESSTATSGSAYNVNPCDKIQMITSVNATDNTSTTWVPMKKEIQLGCEKYPTTEFILPDASDPGFTATITNPDGTLNGDGSSSTTTGFDLGAGDVKTFNIQITGTYEDQLGATAFMVCIPYNTTTQSFDKVELTSGTKVTKPAWETTASAGFAENCYEFPALKSNAVVTVGLVTDVDDAAFDDANLTAMVIPNAAFRDTDTLEYKYAYEDQDSGQVAGASGAITIFLK